MPSICWVSLPGSNNDYMVSLDNVKHTNKQALLDLIRDNTFTIKITNRKIECVC